MSYILDALRKSDQQRQRGAAPTLLAGQATPVAPKQPAYLFYGLLAAVLLGAGMMIGWLRPWQTEQAAPVAKPPEASLRQPVPVRSEIAPAPEPQLQSAPAAAQYAPAPAPVPAPAIAPAPAVASVAAPVQRPAPVPLKAHAPASAGAEAPAKRQDAVAAASKKTAAAPEQPPGAAAADSASGQYVISLAELPLALQQELPPMTVSVHAYSGRPGDRLVGINNRMLREGDYVAPGLKLEQITPDGMIFGYKGFSFRRGVK
jgi:general secretion pathway protein B